MRIELKGWDVVLASAGGILLVLATWLGIGTNVANACLIAYVPLAAAARGWAAYRRSLAVDFVRRPLAREHRWLLVQTLVRWAFLALWALVLRAAIIPAQLGESARSVWAILYGLLLLAALLQLVPRRRVFAARLSVVALALVFFGAQLAMAYLPPKADAVVALSPPMRSELLVFQGGASPLLNHHWVVPAQRNALDLGVLLNGKLAEGNPDEVASHHCFGEPLYAPHEGTVVKVVNDRPDMPIPVGDREQIAGNHVVVAIGVERFVLLAHLKQGSVLVHEGDAVSCGQPLAQCGNSGNTSMPHLHIQVQNRAVWTPDVETYPIVFRDAALVRGASVERRRPPRRNDRIAPDGSELCR